METKVFKELKPNKFIPVFVMIFGSAVVAFGLAGFLVPHRIVAGGTSGLATIIYHLTNLPIGIVALLLDIPLFLWYYFIFGFKALKKSFFTAISLAVFLQIFNLLIQKPLSSDPLLSCVYGGIITGGGMGIIFKFGASTGGTDLLAAILRKYFGWKLGTGLFIADGIIIGLSGLFFSMDLILYGILTVFIASQTVDFIQTGASGGKGLLIVSEHSDEIREAIIAKVNRGVTVFYGERGYKGQRQEILYTVVSVKEVSKVKDVIAEIDKNAFVVVDSVKEVIGEGFLKA